MKKAVLLKLVIAIALTWVALPRPVQAYCTSLCCNGAALRLCYSRAEDVYDDCVNRCNRQSTAFGQEECLKDCDLAHRSAISSCDYDWCFQPV